MATAKTTIELNGKIYDARSGKIIGDAATTRPTPAVRSSGMVVDGFVRRPNNDASPRPKPAIERAEPFKVATKLQKSQTLMRPAVKKPAPVVHKASSDHREASFKKENPGRHVRAASAQKSSLVRKFGSGVQPHTIIKTAAPLPVASTPHHVSSAATVAANKVAHLATSTEAHLMQSVDIIEESLRSASAHLEQFEDKVGKSFLSRVGFKNKFANLGAMTFAGLLLVGFFAYQNAPNVEMHVAAAKSGVSAHMPGYSPAGYAAVRGVKSEPGKVAVTFRSNTDDKAFTVSQQASNWSSDSLLTNHVLATRQPYQTYQEAGKTVYIYDNSNATWVNGGIWYSVDGNASLTSDQLLRIANSL